MDSKNNQFPLPPGLFIIAIILEIIANYFWPIIKLIPLPFSYVGIILMIAGLYLMVWGGKTMRAHRTTVEFRKNPTTLITASPFSFSRNPGYLGQLFLVLGVAVLLGSLSPLSIALIDFLILDRMVLPIEEEGLEKTFGDRYLEYKRSVRRWI